MMQADINVAVAQCIKGGSRAQRKPSKQLSAPPNLSGLIYHISQKPYPQAFQCWKINTFSFILQPTQALWKKKSTTDDPEETCLWDS